MDSFSVFVLSTFHFCDLYRPNSIWLESFS